MHPNPRRIVPVVVLLALAALAYWYFVVQGGRASAAEGALSASGTIEAQSVNISPEVGGRVLTVSAAEGEAVRAGQVLVQFDASLLAVQQRQAEAALAAARAQSEAAAAQAAAAEANLALLRAGASEEQLAVAQTVVDRAAAALQTAQDAYAALPAAAQDTPDGLALAGQVTGAEAALANAEAQYNLAAAGARPEQLAVAEAQARAARVQSEAAAAQAEAAQAGVDLVAAQIGRLTIAAPVDGVVLARAIQPGEVASPGAVLLVVGRLAELTITVYVPETRYGLLHLGQAASVSVDSYPGQTFAATVSHIADQAEFTPRNVQTAEGRATTVFAIKLTVPNPGGQLKPGMPADVVFDGAAD